nr:hypothetical protein GCM10020063_058600 [Dactylosporangium thailandense]
MTIFADEAAERFVLGLRAPGPEPSVARMREGAAQRARERPPGPSVAVEDRVAGHVPVRVYRQEGRTRIVYLHGGGFVLGDLDTHDLVCRRLAAATGATVVAVGYRRAPEHPYPAAVEDALTVLGWAAESGPVAVAGLDLLRDGAVAYARRLRGAGVPATLRVEAGLVHNHPMYAHLGAGGGAGICPVPD